MKKGEIALAEFRKVVNLKQEQNTKTWHGSCFNWGITWICGKTAADSPKFFVVFFIFPDTFGRVGTCF